MDGSRVLIQSLEKLQVASSASLRRCNGTMYRRTLIRAKHSAYKNSATTSARAFSSCRVAQQDPPKPASEESRVDFSKLGIRNPDYVPPPKSEGADAPVRKTTFDSIDALIAQERRRHAGKDAGRQARSGRYNSDVYSIFSRRARDPTKPSSVDPASYKPDMHSMIGGRLETAGLALREVGDEGSNKHLRLKPTLGRTIMVDHDKNFDLTRAFVGLESKINNRGNAVRKDARAQRFHVRRGQAKKIKRRERWRVLFKEGFLAEVGRIRKMIRQGW